jgi:hypothetical protein
MHSLLYERGIVKISGDASGGLVYSNSAALAVRLEPFVMLLR